MVLSFVFTDTADKTINSNRGKTQTSLKQFFLNGDFTELANVSKQLKPCAKKQMAGDDSVKKKT